jgi:hypothetical protein
MATRLHGSEQSLNPTSRRIGRELSETVAAPEGQPQLTTLEWQVVRTAFLDASDSCGTSIRSTVSRLFGFNPPQPLANPRLEKLRVYMCMTRSKGRVPDELIEDLLSLGFDKDQLRALASLADPHSSAQ